MPRPSRQGWSPVTLTLTQEVQTALRVRAAATGIEIGRLADEILRATLEPLFLRVEAIQGDLQVRPLPSSAEGKKVPEHARGKAVVDPREISAQAASSQPLKDRYADPAARAEVEAKFLAESLDHIEETDRWDELLKGISPIDALTYGIPQELWLLRDMAEVIEGWRKLKRVPPPWKAYLHKFAEGEDPWQPSIFGMEQELGPDEFFEWEQPS